MHTSFKYVISNKSKYIELLKEPLLTSTHVHPRIHFVWKMIFNVKNSIKRCHKIWNLIIEQSFLVYNASDRRKYIALQLFEYIIKYLTANDYISDSSNNQIIFAPYFTPHFMSIFVNHLGSKKSHLYKAAVHIKNILMAIAKKDSYALALIYLLTAHHQRFDSRTKTKNY